MLEDFISSVDSTENIYDLIACCSDSIFSVVLNEELFMAEYVDLPPKYQCLRRNQKLIMKQSGSWQNASLRKWLKKMRAYKKRHEINPNLDNLNVLSGSIVRIFDSIKPEEVSMYYAEFKKSLLVLLREFKLVAFLEDPLYNQATIPFFVLRVLDSLLAKLLKFQKKYLGPMGNYRRYKTLVYFADNHTIISEASMQLGFRGKVHPERIQDIVVNLRLVRVDQISAGAAIPKILRIDIDKDQANSLNFCVTNKLSIAFIPYSIHREFAFKPSIGSSFTIKYNDIDEEVMKNRCHALLDCAIQGGANIIAFPEYIISEKMLHEIKSFLKIKMLEEPKSLEKLVMVIAGSTWIENDNNVLHILNRHGTEIAKYYKYSPFTKREKSRQTRDIFKRCERLTEPGKECSLVSVNGIGHILPAICRDVINEDYTSRLAEFFHPSIIFIPAWSPSVASFEERLGTYANRFHASSFLLNSCQAVENRPGAFACVYYPSIPKTTVKGKPIYLQTNSDCIKNCVSKGCVYFIEADYSVEKMKCDQLIRWTQIIC